MLPAGAFVPNDMRLSNADDALVILTGPNMAGKSTYIRQGAIIALMAQIGSFVPAESATIGLVDRIFTRVGLQDDLSVGQSTFMVEMLETASILNHATPRSFIILDEIGAAQAPTTASPSPRAVAAFIHNHPRLGCKTLFATHYHELTQLADTLPRVRNFNVAVSEDRGNVVFLRRIVRRRGQELWRARRAHAGLPGGVVNRAWEVLKELEGADQAAPAAARPGRRVRKPAPEQLSLLTSRPAALEVLLAFDLASMTPIEALKQAL